MNKETMTYVLDVQEDPEIGDQYIQLTEEICEMAGFNPGDILEWLQEDESDSIILRKINPDERE